MKTSHDGLDLIKSFEGFSAKAYDDGVGVITIGYGTTKYPNGAKVKMGDVCTEEQAEQWLAHDVASAEKTINNLVFGKPLTQDQFDALVSFQYNTGAITKSTLYDKAKIDPDDETIYKYDSKNPVDTSEFTRWVKGTVLGQKIVLNGLVTRRKAEADLYSGKKGGTRPPHPH